MMRIMSFLDLELSKTLGSSRTQKFLNEIHDFISKARFTMLAKEGLGRMCEMIIFNMKRSYLAGMKKEVSVVSTWE